MKNFIKFINKKRRDAPIKPEEEELCKMPSEYAAAPPRPAPPYTMYDVANVIKGGSAGYCEKLPGEGEDGFHYYDAYETVDGFCFMIDRWSGFNGSFCERKPSDGYVYARWSFSDAGNFRARCDPEIHGYYIIKKADLEAVMKRVKKLCSEHNARITE